MKRLLSVAAILATTSLATFVGCDGDVISTSSSSRNTPFFGSGLFNFFAKPILDTVVATQTAFTRLSLPNSPPRWRQASKQGAWSPADFGVTPAPNYPPDRLDFSRSDFANNNCLDLIVDYPLGKAPGYLPTWYTKNTTKNPYLNNGVYKLGVMAEYAFAFLLDVHCHGYALFGFTQAYATHTQRRIVALDQSLPVNIGFNSLYVRHKPSRVGLAWKREGDFFVGTMRFDTYLCSQNPDGYSNLPGLFPNGGCGAPASTNKFREDEDSFSLTSKHAIYKMEKENPNGSETRYIQIKSRFTQTLNYAGHYCKQVLDSVQQSIEINGVVGISGYAKLSLDESGDSLDESCGDLIDDAYTGHNSFTVTQFLEVAQTPGGSTIHYRCDNTGNYAMRRNTAPDNAFWKTYPAWCYYHADGINPAHAPAGDHGSLKVAFAPLRGGENPNSCGYDCKPDPDNAPVGAYDYSTNIVKAEFNASGEQVGANSAAASYAFTNETTLIKTLEAIADSDFDPDEVHTAPLWEF